MTGMTAECYGYDSHLDRSAVPGRDSRYADSIGNSASRALMIPLYGSSLCVGLDRGAYCVLPAASSRSNWPVSIQWWIVLRLILNCLDSSAFVMLLLSPTAWNARAWIIRPDATLPRPVSAPPSRCKYGT